MGLRGGAITHSAKAQDAIWEAQDRSRDWVSAKKAQSCHQMIFALFNMNRALGRVQAHLPHTGRARSRLESDYNTLQTAVTNRLPKTLALCKRR
jgi:hypothetical protein